MAIITRRDLLATASHAYAGMRLGTFCAPSPFARPVSNSRTKRGTPDTLFPERAAPDTLQQLATAAVEAARQAGATYADVRVAEQHDLAIGRDPYTPLAPDVRLWVTFTYGVRVLMDGQWAFAHGTAPDPDAIVATARHAVARVREYRAAGLRQSYGDFVSAPVVNGTWMGPCRIDPFTVPLDDQCALLQACSDAAERPHGGALTLWSHFAWTRETRVFASSEGSLVTQVMYRSTPDLSSIGDRGAGLILVNLPQLVPLFGGYETVVVPDLQDQLKAASEEAVRLAMLPHRTVDVGRYSIVADGFAVSTILGATLSPALELDRAIGDDIDASGSSFLSPAEQMVGQSLFSPLLTVTAGQASSAGATPAWDDEGIASQVNPVIRNGQLVDYHTTRQTASVLHQWYQQQGHPTQSHGCAMAPTAADVVSVRAPHMTVTPSPHAATLEDLCQAVQRGILLRDAHVTNLFVGADQQFASGYIHAGQLLEIERGHAVRRLDGAGLEFTTRNLWKSLTAIGDATTIRTTLRHLYKGEPWVKAASICTSPAGLFHDVNVITVGRRG